MSLENNEGFAMETDKGLAGVTTPGTIAAYTTACLLFPASYQVGDFFSQLNMPTISGYLVTGVLCGPHGLGVLSPDASEQLWLADDLCLAAIALAAGSQLRWTDMKNNIRTVSILGVSVLCFTWLSCLIAMLIISEQLDFLQHLSEGAHVSASVVSATIMVARSPASAIAVMRELDAKGRFSTVVLSVAILIDVIVILVFSLAVEYAHSVHGGGEFHFLLSALMPIMHIALCLFLGAMLGQAILWVLYMGRHYLEEWRSLAVLTLACIWYYTVQDIVHSEPLLACVVAGIWVTNRIDLAEEADKEGGTAAAAADIEKTAPSAPKELGVAESASDTDSLPPTPSVSGSVREAGSVRVRRRTKVYPKHLTKEEKLPHIVGLALPFINVAFFTLGGSKLDLDSLSKTLSMSLFLFGTRMMALFTGASVGSYLAGWPESYVRVCWMAFVTQAGVSLGLAKEVAETFPDWGDSLCSLLVSVIVLNQLVGPPLFKLALISAGDANPEKLAKKKGQSILDKLLGRYDDETDFLE